MIKRIDTAISRAHQWAVDLTQKQPSWWGRNCAIGMAVPVVIRAALFDASGWWVVMLLIAIFYWVMARVPAFFHDLGLLFRMLCLAMLSVDLGIMCLFIAVGVGIPPEFILSTMAMVCLNSYVYFGTCRPPRPRPPKRRVTAQTFGFNH